MVAQEEYVEQVLGREEDVDGGFDAGEGGVVDDEGV